MTYDAGRLNRIASRRFGDHGEKTPSVDSVQVTLIQTIMGCAPIAGNFYAE
jgi:hypothetical protein